MRSLAKRLVWVVLGLGVAALVVAAFLPSPVEVDVAETVRGPLRVTVDHEGKTRVKERFVVFSPVAGQMQRVTLKAGDEVLAGRTPLTTIYPTPPTLLDVRAREEAEARVRGAEAALRQAEVAIGRAQAELAQAQVTRRRMERVAQTDAASQEELEQAVLEVTVREAAVRAATFARDVARFNLEQAQAALTQAGGGAAATNPSAATDPQPVELVSPITGRVLRVMQESESTVTPGTPILELGDVRDIEAVVDVLSRDAVQIRPGAAALLERWGGGEPLRGTVRRVEPSGFTKISALGVEEQRVNVIIDLADPLETRPALGDGFRVDARIITWQAPDVLKVPVGALFREGADWAVFRVTDGKVTLQPLKIGQMNDQEAEVLEGLRPGDRVVIHPSDKVKAGVQVVAR